MSELGRGSTVTLGEGEGAVVVRRQLSIYVRRSNMMILVIIESPYVPTLDEFIKKSLQKARDYGLRVTRDQIMVMFDRVANACKTNLRDGYGVTVTALYNITEEGEGVIQDTSVDRYKCSFARAWVSDC